MQTKIIQIQLLSAELIIYKIMHRHLASPGACIKVTQKNNITRLGIMIDPWRKVKYGSSSVCTNKG